MASQLNQTISNHTINGQDSFGRDWYVKHVMHILYGVLATTAVIGNALVCTIILITKNGRMLKSGLNVLILSMATMDAMTGVVMFIVPSFVVPAAEYIYPTNNISGMLFCRVIASQYIFFYFGFGSVFTITAIAIERWIAIARPYTYRNIVTVNRTKTFVICLWLLNTITPLDIVFQIKFEKHKQPPCQWNNFVRQSPGVYIFVTLEVLRIYIPVIIIIISYLDITRRMICSHPSVQIRKSMPRPLISRRSTNSLIRRRKVTIMVAVSAIAFIACWLPNELYFTLYALKAVTHNIDITRTTKTLIVFSSCISPFIYTVTNEDYRQGIWKLLTWCKTSKIPLHNSSSLRNAVAPIDISKNVSTQHTNDT